MGHDLNFTLAPMKVFNTECMALFVAGTILSHDCIFTANVDVSTVLPVVGWCGSQFFFTENDSMSHTPYLPL